MAKTYRIVIAEDQQELMCSDSQNILLAAITNGIRSIERGCLGGGCGLCKVQVESGSYQLGLSSVHALPLEEREKGYVLACKTVPTSDLTIRIKNGE